MASTKFAHASERKGKDWRFRFASCFGCLWLPTMYPVLFGNICKNFLCQLSFVRYSIVKSSHLGRFVAQDKCWRTWVGHLVCLLTPHAQPNRHLQHAIFSCLLRYPTYQSGEVLGVISKVNWSQELCWCFSVAQFVGPERIFLANLAMFGAGARCWCVHAQDAYRVVCMDLVMHSCSGGFFSRYRRKCGWIFSCHPYRILPFPPPPSKKRKTTKTQRTSGPDHKCAVEHSSASEYMWIECRSKQLQV